MMYYKLDGKIAVPCSMEEWVECFEDVEKRIVAQDEIDGVTVSTVFLGVDQEFMPELEPAIYETMAFWPDAYLSEKLCNRYATWDEAEQGHKEAIDRIRTQKMLNNYTLRHNWRKE